MLKYWYSHLQCAVLWKGVLGNILILHMDLDKGVSYRHFCFQYMNELIRKLRSGYGLHIGNVFTGCIMYADDIMLLACSCFGLQQLVDVSNMESSGI